VSTAAATFKVTSFEPTEYTSPVTVGTSVGHALMVKEFEGAIAGRSTTQFSFAFDQAAGVGTYVALEAFEGTLDGKSGTFAFAHSATTDAVSPGRLHELVVIAPGSGTGELAGLTGTGSITIDADDTHRLVLDYAL
jgi:hypothetical protein